MAFTTNGGITFLNPLIIISEEETYECIAKRLYPEMGDKILDDEQHQSVLDVLNTERKTIFEKMKNGGWKLVETSYCDSFTFRVSRTVNWDIRKFLGELEKILNFLLSKDRHIIPTFMSYHCNYNHVVAGIIGVSDCCITHSFGREEEIEDTEGNLNCKKIYLRTVTKK